MISLHSSYFFVNFGLMFSSWNVSCLHFEVYPFASIADAVPMAVPRLLVNMTPVGSFGSRGDDSLILGDLVDGISKLAKELKWDMELDHMVAGGS